MLLPVLAALLVAALWTATLWRIGYERAQNIREASSDADGSARTFAERTRRLLREIDQATRFLKLELERRDARGEPMDLAEYTRRQGLLPTDVTLRISIVDEHGDVRASNKPFAPVNVADRTYFKAHAASAGDDLLVSPPLFGRGLQRVVVALSRRFNHGSGAFAGLVVMAVDPEYFTGVYEPSVLLTHGFVGLLGTDGAFRAARIGDKAMQGDPMAFTAFQAWATAPPGETRVLDSPFDGERRIFSHQPVVGFPLVAIAGISEDEALAGFQRQRALYLGSAAIASVVLGGLAALLFLQGLRLQTSRRNDVQSAARLGLITDNMPALISYLDADQRIRFANHAYRDWLGLEPGGIVGQSLLELYGADVHAEIRPHIEAALAGRTVTYEREMVTVDGPRHVSVTAVPHRDEKGKVLGLYVMTTDLTVQRGLMQVARQQDEAIALAHRQGVEQRLALQLSQHLRKAAEDANMAKSGFLATMSHEIRTPMNGVVGMIDVLAQSRLTDEQADAVATIRSSALALLGCIDDILDFSKIEAGGIELERCVVAPGELVEGVCATLGPLASSQGVTLSLFIDPRVPGHVWADPTRLRQVLYNLVGNAIKFSAGRPDVTGSVSVRVEVANAVPLNLAFSIADNGIGISRNALDRIFQPFVQAESTTTRRFGGTGLGLVISKRLVGLMQGDIAVTSEPGQGSTFTVTLPLEAADAPQHADIAAIAELLPERHEGPLAGHLILVAEDDEVSRKVIRMQLNLLGYGIDVASDGLQALQQWRNGKYSLLITDLHMPEMDGYMLAQIVRREEKARDPSGATRIPILALTANAQREESARARATGIDGYLTKPILLAVLRAALTKWLPRLESPTATRATEDPAPRLH
jgi:PAS domain S-box-containing protein